MRCVPKRRDPRPPTRAWYNRNGPLNGGRGGSDTLTNALTALSKQYEAEMEQQAEWVGELQEQEQRLEESVKDLQPQLGPERDFGLSR